MAENKGEEDISICCHGYLVTLTLQFMYILRTLYRSVHITYLEIV